MKSVKKCEKLDYVETAQTPPRPLHCGSVVSEYYVVYNAVSDNATIASPASE